MDIDKGTKADMGMDMDMDQDMAVNMEEYMGMDINTDMDTGHAVNICVAVHYWWSDIVSKFGEF